MLAAGGEDRILRVWDVRSGKIIRRLMGNAGTVSSICWSLSGDLLVSGGADGTIQAWRAQEGQELTLLAGHAGTVTSVACGPDGRSVASIGGDDTVRIWDVQSAKALHELPAHAKPSPSGPVLFIEGGRSVVTSSEQVILFWDPTTGRLQKRLFCEACGKAMAVNGPLIATIGYRSYVLLIDTATGEVRGRLSHNFGDSAMSNRPVALSWSHDGRFLAIGVNDELIQIWEPTAGSPTAILHTQAKHPRLRSLEYFLDGLSLISKRK